MVRALIPVTLLLVLLGNLASAQIDISLSVPRSAFLLFEPVNVEVEIKNVGEKMLVLSNDAKNKESWLQFVIQGADDKIVKADVPFEIEGKVIKPDQSITVSADIMTHYAMRTTGQYRVKAIVKVNDDTAYMSPSLVVNVGAGETVWKQVKFEKKYSLLRFMVNHQTFLYLRVEDANRNIVYCTHQLGSCNLSYRVPDPVFDSDGNLHILHPRSPLEFRLTVIDPKGSILGVEEYDGRWNMPTLTVKPSGEVIVNGTKVSDAQKSQREKLSDVQQKNPAPAEKQ